MKGSLIKQNLSIKSVAIHYDNPIPITVDQIMEPSYASSYAMGDFVGLVLPSGLQSTEGLTITAQVFSQIGQSFEIRFNLQNALDIYGNGVYTLLLWTEDNYLTTYSLWFKN